MPAKPARQAGGWRQTAFSAIFAAILMGRGCMKLTFLGATHEVTGSCYYLEADGKRILIDCGMEQGRDMFENQAIPVKASDIDMVLLTHAHIDHSGLLPLLSGKAFRDRFSPQKGQGNCARSCCLTARTSRNPRRSGKTARPCVPASRRWNPCTTHRMRRTP